jgi:Zn-dependent protease
MAVVDPVGRRRRARRAAAATSAAATRRRDGPFQSPVAHPSVGWALATGLAVAAVYALSIVAHELGHLLAARRSGISVSAVVLHLFGGHVEIDDDDRLTAGRLARIVGAGRCRARSRSTRSRSSLNSLPARMLDGGQMLAAARLW